MWHSGEYLYVTSGSVPEVINNACLTIEDFAKPQPTWDESYGRESRLQSSQVSIMKDGVNVADDKNELARMCLSWSPKCDGLEDGTSSTSARSAHYVPGPSFKFSASERRHRELRMEFFFLQVRRIYTNSRTFVSVLSP